MGIPRGPARLLLDEARERGFSGSVLELGRMFVYATRAELERWAGRQGCALRPPHKLELSHDPRLAAQGCLSDRSFFEMLGFDEVACLDISGYEGAEIIHDLNLPVPEQLHERYDVVFESGTMQHIFHQPNVLANIARMVKPGGRVIHAMLPSHNHVDHGYYMYSPVLFYDWYIANGFRIEAAWLMRFHAIWYRGRLSSAPWTIHHYSPGVLDDVSYGGFGHEQLSLFVVATRLPDAGWERIPQQGHAAGVMGRGDAGVPYEGAMVGGGEASWAGSLAEQDWFVSAYLRGKRVKQWFKRQLRRHGLPPVVARY